jgi:hypothetical protein
VSEKFGEKACHLFTHPISPGNHIKKC